MNVDLQPYASPEHRPFEMGNGSNGALLIHGFAGTPADILELGVTLAQMGWHSRGILLPGFGADIVNLRDRGQSDWLNAASAAWDEMRKAHKQNILLGFSFGASIAINLAHRSAPHKLILVAPFWSFPGWLRFILPVAYHLFPNIKVFKKANFNDNKIRSQLAKIIPTADLDDPAVQETIRESFSLPLRAIHEALQLGRKSFKLAVDINVPTMVIQGIQDTVVTPSQTWRLVQRFNPGIRSFHEIQAGHDLLQPGSTGFIGATQLITEFVAS